MAKKLPYVIKKCLQTALNNAKRKQNKDKEKH